MEIVQDITKLLADGGWVAFAAFGAFLAYKLAFTSILSVSVLKLGIRIVNYAQAKKESEQKAIQAKAESEQKLLQIAANAGMSWPLTLAQWDEINTRVRPRAEAVQKAA